MSDRPSADARRAKRRRIVAGTIRLVLVAIVSTACFLTLLVLALFNFAGGRLGWIPSLLAFGGLGLVTGWLAVSNRWHTARRRTAMGLAVLGGIVGIAVAHSAPPTAGRLRHEIEVVAQPGWHLRDETVDGNAWCFDYCTAVSRVYRVGASVDAVLQELRPVLASDGLQFTLGFDRSQSYMFDRDGGDVDLSVDIERDTNNRSTIISITATAS